MNNVQSDNQNLRNLGHGTMIRSSISVSPSAIAKKTVKYCVIAAICFAVMVSRQLADDAFSQSGIAAPVAPNVMMSGYNGPSGGSAVYGHSAYGSAAAPMVGPYYSGNSPMMQPQVAISHPSQMTAAQLAYLQSTYPQSGMGYDTAMASSYPVPGYDGNAYATMMQPNMSLYGQSRYDQHMTDYDAASQVAGQPNSTQSSYNQYMPLRSPLLETGWEQAKLLSPFNAPDGPHRGVGKPLEDESWLDRPYYFGLFGGWVSGDKLVSGQIDQKSGGNGGVTLGWNLNHYWGAEARLFGSSIDIKDISGSATPTSGRSNRLTVLDASAHYYPYGEAKWRPYFKLGIGFAEERFTDNYGTKYKLNTWTVPVGVGLKYWWSDRVNVYGEIVDNVIFGKGPTKTHGNVALNFGVNFTFGTNPNYHPTVYWPQTPSKPY